MKKLKLDKSKLKLSKAIISSLSDSEMNKVNAGYGPSDTCVTQNGQATCLSQGCVNTNPSSAYMCGASNGCGLSATCATNTCPSKTCTVVLTGCF